MSHACRVCLGMGRCWAVPWVGLALVLHPPPSGLVVSGASCFMHKVGVSLLILPALLGLCGRGNGLILGLVVLC